jgi:dTMP kinase
VDVIAELNAFAVDGVAADLVILLEVEARDARERLGADLDRIEHAGSELADLVQQTYREFAAADPNGWAVVDGRGSIDDVAQRIDAVVAARLGL